MTPQTFYAVMNTSEIDFDKFTIADAVGYAEFEEDIASWEDTSNDEA